MHVRHFHVSQKFENEKKMQLQKCATIKEKNVMFSNKIHKKFVFSNEAFVMSQGTQCLPPKKYKVRLIRM